MHHRDPAHVIIHDLHGSRLSDVLTGAWCISSGLIIQPDIEIAVKLLAPSSVSILCADHLSITFPGKQLVYPCHHWTSIVSHRQEARARHLRALELCLTQIAPHCFFHIVLIDGEIHRELVGTICETLGIIIY